LKYGVILRLKRRRQTTKQTTVFDDITNEMCHFHMRHTAYPLWVAAELAPIPTPTPRQHMRRTAWGLGAAAGGAVPSSAEGNPMKRMGQWLFEQKSCKPALHSFFDGIGYWKGRRLFHNG
jgi:hypothetical protein